MVTADLGALSGDDPDSRVVTGVPGGALQCFADADINDRVATLPYLRASMAGSAIRAPADSTGAGKSALHLC